MNNHIKLSSIFEFIHVSDLVSEVVNDGCLAGISSLGVCPADQVPEDGLEYIVFVGRTAKNPSALLEKTKAKLIVLDAGIPLPKDYSNCIVLVKNARLFFCELLSFVASEITASISERAVIHPTAVIGEGTSIGDYSCIGEGVVIGSFCSISSHVSILKNVSLGDRVNVSAGAVIGTDGFGYEQRGDGTFIRFPHIGGVRIGNDVDIGGNTVIDRGALGMTVIEDGVKIDNLVHIAHNVHIEMDSLIIANAMVAGGVRVGKGSWIGPSSNILDRVSVGEKAFVGMGVSVVKEIPPNGRFTLRNFFNLFPR